MSDVVISYAQANAASARQLAEAVQREGYDVWRSDSGSDAANSDSVTERIVAAKAVIVIWSDAAAASEWIRAEASVARGMKKLIQASADGNPPPIPFDAAQVSSISTWLGDESHPGWQAIKAGLAGLAGVPAAAPEPEEAPVAAMPPEPAAPLPEAESLSDPEPPAAPQLEPLSAPAPAKGPSGALIAIIAVVIVALLAAGAWFYARSQPVATATAENAAAPEPEAETPAPAPAPEGVPAPEAPMPANEDFDREAVLRGTAVATLRSSPSTIGLSVARLEPGERFSTYQQSSDWWRVRTVSGAVGYLGASSISLIEPGAASSRTLPGPTGQEGRPDRRAEQRQPRGPRIRKENSEVMAAYCEGAGRGTPQCRRFERSAY